MDTADTESLKYPNLCSTWWIHQCLLCWGLHKQQLLGHLKALWLKIFQGWPKQQTIIIRNMWSTSLRNDENSREMFIVLDLMQTGSSINNPMSQGREITGFSSHLLHLILYQIQGTMHQTSTKFNKYYFIFISSPKVAIG